MSEKDEGDGVDSLTDDSIVYLADGPNLCFHLAVDLRCGSLRDSECR